MAMSLPISSVRFSTIPENPDGRSCDVSQTAAEPAAQSRIGVNLFAELCGRKWGRLRDSPDDRVEARVLKPWTCSAPDAAVSDRLRGRGTGALSEARASVPWAPQLLISAQRRHCLPVPPRSTIRRPPPMSRWSRSRATPHWRAARSTRATTRRSHSQYRASSGRCRAPCRG